MAKLRAYYFSGGDFDKLISRRSTNENVIETVEQMNKYRRIAKKTTSNSGVTSAHIVGLDGVTNGLSVLLRSIARKK